MPDLRLLRLNAQHLLAPADDPAGNLCGLQAQFLRNAVHALRLRTRDLRLDGLVKTWTLRGTVHLVPEKDLPLYLPLCGTAEDVCESPWYRWSAGCGEVNPPERERHFARIMAEAISAGIDTREELRLHLRGCGMTDAEESRLFDPWGGLIRELAEAGVLAFRAHMADEIHPDETKRYRLLAPFTPMDEKSARIELLRRYFTHYGPAALRDAAYFFRWTQSEVKALLPHLPVETMEFAGRTHFFIPGNEPPCGMPPVILLAGFDPLMMGYRKEDNPFLPQEHLRGIFNLAGIVNPAILLRGRVVGKWKEKDGKAEFTAFEPLTAADKALIGQAAERLFPVKKIKWI